MSEGSGNTNSLFSVTTILAGVSIVLTVSVAVYLYRETLSIQETIKNNNQIILNEVAKRVGDESRARADAINDISKRLDSMRSITTRNNTHISNIKGSVNEIDVNISKIFDIINEQSEKIEELTEKLDTLQDEFDELKQNLPDEYLPTPKLVTKKKVPPKKAIPKAPQYKKTVTNKKQTNNTRKPTSTLINEDNNQSFDGSLEDEIDEFNMS